MEFIIIAVAVFVMLMFLKNFGEKDVEKFTSSQMIGYTKSLQNKIDRLKAISNPSESVKAKIIKKESQWNHAMSVWKRKNEEAAVS